MFLFDLRLDDGIAHGKKLVDSVNRIQLLHLFRLYHCAPERVQSRARELCIVAQVREQLPVIRQSASTRLHVTQLPIQQIASQAVTKHTTEKVLLVESGKHQGRRDRGGIAQQVHVVSLQ